MCGLTGFYERNTDRSRSELRVIAKAMTDSLTHRGPDSGDFWLDPDLSLALGHRRLSILDLSPEGAQPMQSPSGRYTIAFNGEIYNHLDLRRDLDAAGFQFRGRSDTETLLAAIDHWGLNQSLQKINGMFAFALWDRKTRQLHFARDRLGKKPLYIGRAGQALVFGSELKALRSHPEFVARVNQESLAAYMQCGYCSAPNCIYDGVWALPAGQRLSIDTQMLESRMDLSRDMIPYWDAVQVMHAARGNPNTKSETEILDEFETLLSQCVSDRLISDVPLGAFLSGGIDSASVAALMQKISNSPIKTYTIGFHEAGFDEAVHAKTIAAHLGTDHHEMYVNGQDALNTIPKLPEIYDEPFADISAIPTYLVSQFARDSVTVALTGDGGDEMLGGYARYIEGPKIWKSMRRFPKPIRGGLAKLIAAISTEKWDALNRKHPQFGTRMHKMAGMLSHDTQEAVYRSLLGRDADAAMDLPDLGKRSFAEAMMVWDTIGYLPNDILTKIDRASMAVSLEARAPLLDYRIFEFAWRLPETHKIQNGKGKLLLRKLLNRYVPDHLFERPKQGFSIPVSAWLREDLKDWGEDLLDAKSLNEQGFLDTDSIRQTWSEHQNHQGNHAHQLWRILMFQAWHRHWA